MPDLALVEQLLPGALGIALMSFTETIAAGRAFARPTDPPINANRELIATGAANLGGALLGAMPAGGGTSQTAVVRSAGGQSQKASLVTAGAALATMLLLAPLLGLMPNATLAAVVIVYSVGLIQPAEFRAIRSVRTMEFRWALIACVGVLVFGTLKGIVVAIIVSMIGLASQAANPRVSVIGRKRGADVLRPLSPEHPDDETFEGLLIVRPEGRLFFVNAQNVAEQISALVAQHQPRVLALDMSRVPDIEYSALQALMEGEKRVTETRHRRLAGGAEPRRARGRAACRARRSGSAASACCSTPARRSNATRRCRRPPSRALSRAANGSDASPEHDLRSFRLGVPVLHGSFKSESHSMNKITPRWEWRSFGRCFGEAEKRLAALTPQGVQESDEIYLLSGAGGNVKVRAALMDIKVLQQVNEDGLEQWTPVMKAEFPLSAADAARVFASLVLPVPSLPRASYTLDEFIEAFAKPGAAIRTVKVHKRRTRYAVGGCMAELSEVVANGKPTRTIAVESEDAQAVVRAVRELGLGGYVNTSYPRGLAALIDDAPARYAVIDVGTNSVKFHIGEREPGGTWRTVVDRAEMTRLGEGFGQQRVISAAALERTAAAIEGMVDEAKRHGILAIAAVGTAGLRIAANGDEVVAAVAARTGLRIEVISGEDEGRLAYLGARSGLGRFAGSLVVFDTGGGSSQFSFGHDSVVDERFSVDVGAVRYTERYKLDGAVSLAALHEAMAAISADLSRIEGRQVPDALVAMGGAVTNITAVMHRLATYDATVVQGSVIDRAEIDRQIELYRTRDADARRAIVGLQPKRAEVILAGACIVRTVMEKLGKHSFIVSDRGLRHGVLAERFGA